MLKRNILIMTDHSDYNYEDIVSQAQLVVDIAPFAQAQIREKFARELFAQLPLA